MNNSLVLAVVLLFVGAGAGLLVGLSLGSADDPAPPIGTADRTEASADTESKRSPAPETAEPDKRPPAAKKAPAGLPDLDAIVKSISTADLTGTGTITGHVRTSDGKPLAGVLVRATANSQRSGRRRRSDEPPSDVTLASRIRGAVRAHYRTVTLRSEVKTDTTGRYVLAGIGKGTYRVWAYSRGHDMSPPRRSRWMLAKAGDELDFTASPVIWLGVSVLLPDGKPARQASLTFAHGNSSESHRWSPEAPDIKVKPGTYRVKATTDDGYASAAELVTVDAGKEPATLTLQMRSFPSILGRVTFTEIPPKFVYVFLMQHEGGPLPDKRRLGEAGKNTHVSSYDDFRYKFLELEPGNYAIGVGRDHGVADVVELVTVGDSRVQKDILLPPPGLNDYAKVWVHAPGGKLLSEVEFETKIKDDGGSSSGGTTAVRAKDGSFWVRHRHERPHARKGKRYFVTAKTTSYGEQEVEYKKAPGVEVHIRFAESSTLEVTVAGYVGSPYVGKVSVQVMKAGETIYFSGQSNNLDRKGVAKLGPLQVGKYDVVLYIRAERQQSREVGRTPVVLRAGENRTTLTLPRLHSLTVQFDGESGSRVRLQSVAGGRAVGGSQEVGDDGRATFENLSPGEYLVTTMVGGEQMRVRVPARGVVRFAPKPVNAMLVTVTDPKGKLAGAGLRSGDMVIGIEGKIFEDMADIQTRLRRAMRKKSVSFTVLRGGRQFTVQFDARNFRGGGDKMGGRMDPASR